MVTKEIKQNVEDCIVRYKELKQVFLKFSDLCYNILSKDNFFEISFKKINDGMIEIDMLSTTISLQFSLKKNEDDTLPIGCIDFYGRCESGLTLLWCLYFDEKGDVFERVDTKFNSANILNISGIETFFYLILDKYMKHECFGMKGRNYNNNQKFLDSPEHKKT